MGVGAPGKGVMGFWRGAWDVIVGAVWSRGGEVEKKSNKVPRGSSSSSSSSIS